MSAYNISMSEIQENRLYQLWCMFSYFLIQHLEEPVQQAHSTETKLNQR